MKTTRKNYVAKSGVWLLSVTCFVALTVWSSNHLSANEDDQDKAPTVHQGIEAVRRNVGPAKCGECHESELASWKSSAHQTSYDSMHKSPLGKSIAKKLGIRRIKKDDSCVRCHYTQMMSREKPKVKLGVTCESCHGPAKDWLAIHDDFGGKGLKRKDEAADHRAMRHSRLQEFGMNHPDQIYYLASKCFSCHVIDEPKLLANDVGHPEGEKFELLSWSQGEVRHNFVSGGGKENSAADLNHKRVLFALGRALEVEHLLRALTNAKSGSYFELTSKRLQSAMARLAELSKLIPGDKELAATVAALASLELRPGNAVYGKMTQELSRLGKSISKRDGSTLAAIDALLPKDYRGVVHQ